MATIKRQTRVSYGY